MPVIGRRLALASFLMLAASPAWSQGDAAPQTAYDVEAGKALAEGVKLVQAGKQAEALTVFARVAAGYDGTYNDPKVTYFSARTPTEGLLYATQVAAQGGSRGVVASANWAYAHYLKGYMLIELRRLPEAKVALSRAVALSPQNAQFLGELGHVYEVEKNWPQALAIYQRAEAGAKEFSPPNARNAELSRAWRGEGFVLVELKRWDEAEQRYRQCLALNKDDAKAQQGLPTSSARRPPPRAESGAARGPTPGRSTYPCGTHPPPFERAGVCWFRGDGVGGFCHTARV